MNCFWKQAQEIYETAGRNPMEDCRMAILVGREGRIGIASVEGWDLEALRVHHGASAVYGVTRQEGRVRVEARSAEGRGLLESAPVVPAHFGLPDWPRYELTAHALEIPAA